MNLAPYRQFTVCCLRLDYSKKKKIKIALSLGYPNSYFYNKRCNMLLQWLHLSFFGLYNVAAFCQSQCHSSCLIIIIIIIMIIIIIIIIITYL